jgi:hypothetical protein
MFSRQYFGFFAKNVTMNCRFLFFGSAHHVRKGDFHSIVIFSQPQFRSQPIVLKTHFDKPAYVLHNTFNGESGRLEGIWMGELRLNLSIEHEIRAMKAQSAADA